jgi:hypothetical protein
VPGIIEEEVEETFKEGQGPRRAVEPIVMVMNLMGHEKIQKNPLGKCSTQLDLCLSTDITKYGQ